jgi:hypothetical protein
MDVADESGLRGLFLRFPSIRENPSDPFNQRSLR